MIKQVSGLLNKPYLLVLLTGLLLMFSWPEVGFAGFIFFAWVPLLMAEEKIKSPFGFFFSMWGAFLIWNTGTTWWIWNSTGAGAAGAIIANSLIMCFPIMLYRFSRKRIGKTWGLVALASYWISFEFIHHNWDLSWPWLTLGNVFATQPTWIQWYAYTGTTGGTIWVWVVNLLIFSILSKNEHINIKRNRLNWGLVILLLSPVFIGWIWYPEPSAEHTQNLVKENVVVVQPNVEAYYEKFNTDPGLLTQRMIDLSESKMDSATRLLVWPETAIPSQAWEHEIPANPVFQQVFQFMQRHPQTLLVTGIDSYKSWGTASPGGFSIRQMKNGNYYEAFNTAMGYSNHDSFQLYHKSKLVPGVESLPSWLGFMSSLFDDFGGISGSLGRSDSAIVLKESGNPYVAAPIICYESIYSDYVTEYVRHGANILTIITNDGWWGNTVGHLQHFNYARLRAIETGLWVARSANTGISAFIDPAGHVYQPQPWDTKVAIKMNIPPVTQPSFYAKTGDWMSRMNAVLSLLLIGISIIFTWLWKRK